MVLVEEGLGLKRFFVIADLGFVALAEPKFEARFCRTAYCSEATTPLLVIALVVGGMVFSKSNGFGGTSILQAVR